MDEKDLRLQNEIKDVFGSMMGSLILNRGKPYDVNTIKEYFNDFDKLALNEFLDHQDANRLLERGNMMKLEFLKRITEETKNLSAFMIDENRYQIEAFIKDLKGKWKEQMKLAKELGAKYDEP